MAEKVCDIVLEGGGVKGTGLVGALNELEQDGYQFRRVAGTSAGAIVGSLVAAGMPLGAMTDVMQHLDYTLFRDMGPIDRLGWPGKAASIIFEKGIYEGKYLRTWLAGLLSQYGVRTWSDLKLTEPWAQKLPPEQRYRLVVIVSDVSRGRMVRLPWDYSAYGLNPDHQFVADAVRASMAIPYFYEPVNLKGRYLVDGGLLSNFPIGLFDNIDDWPTFGIKLAAKEKALNTINPVTTPLEYAMAIFGTAQNAHDQLHIDDPCTQKRTIFVDTFDVKATDFDITADERAKLYQSGRKAAGKFLTTWDFAKYKQACGKNK